MERQERRKILGHRKVETDNPSDLIQDVRILQATINALRNYALVPRGLFRFRSFQEADQWMLQTIAATHARLNSKTS